VSHASVRLENTSDSYAPRTFPAVADPDVTEALLDAARETGRGAHLGLTASAPGFYAPQGRPALETTFPDGPDIDHLAALGVLNFEMESSLLFTMSLASGLRAGCLCAVYADRRGGSALTDEGMLDAEAACIDAGLEAVTDLADRVENGHWSVGGEWKAGGEEKEGR
jgi:uridine phosphorylase